MIDVAKFINSIPVIGAAVHFTCSVLNHVADAAGSVSQTTLHTAGDKIYAILQAGKEFVHSFCGGGVPPVPPVAPPVVPPVVPPV